jgi:hypothetical protein
MDTLGIKILKTVVFAMALLLIVGIIVLVVRIVDRQKHAQPVENIPTIGELQLATTGRVVKMAPLEGGMALLVEADASQELVILDHQGSLVRRIRLVPLGKPDGGKTE